MHINQFTTFGYFRLQDYFVHFSDPSSDYYRKYPSEATSYCKEIAGSKFNPVYQFAFHYKTADLDTLIATIHRLEDSLGIEPKSQFIPIEGNWHPVIQVVSPFWLGRLINFDLFCCIWKTLRIKDVNQLNAINTYLDIPRSKYFTDSGTIRWALKNIVDLPQILGVEDGQDKNYLYSLNSNGLVRRLSDVKKNCKRLREQIDEVKKEYLLTTTNKGV